MTLKFKKCFFARPTVQFLGHIVGSGKMSVVSGKITAIKALPEPSPKKYIRSFLGLCYTIETIPLFSDTAAPLTELTKGGKVGSIKFTDHQLVEQLKDKLCEGTSLAVPYYSKPFQIQCDASAYAIRWCFSQIDSHGQEQPLAFGSSKLSETQGRWSTIEKEAYAVVYALQQFEHIVFGSMIDLYTDHNPLQYIVINNTTCTKLTRWALHLSKFCLTIHHKSGVLNNNAECLSRLILI